MLTDIHFGRKNNSESHNQDCLNFLEWFCSNVRKDKDIDCIFFLGDWHEQRSAINGMTLTFSETGANMLNELGLPVMFVTGNHDLYYRNSRDIFTTIIFNKLENFTLISKPVVIEQNNCVLAPYLFEHEYDDFFKTYKKYDVIAGHWEFKGFILTGETSIKESGPDHTKYKTHKKIFSGHYHKRQQQNNVFYIGSCFPMDFSDVNDIDRGMTTYDFSTDTVEYINWDDCPKYIKAKLSDVMNNPKKILKPNSRVKVIVDESMTLSQTNEIKKALSEKFNLRELNLEEQFNDNVDISDIEKEVEELKLESINDIVPELLKRIKNDNIDSNTLVNIYRTL